MTSRTGSPVVHIDEDACTGCGLCVTECVEGAIRVVDGKARLIGEGLCDGIGVCVGVCPAGALSVEPAPGAVRSDAAPAREPRPEASLPSEFACALCGASEERATLVAVRMKGENAWCCTGCLPRLIHP